jgi:hypothetical protein
VYAFIANLAASSLNNLTVFLNSKYLGVINKQGYAWYDFYKNSQHIGQEFDINLNKGINNILIFVEGGNYSGDGFYANIDTQGVTGIGEKEKMQQKDYSLFQNYPNPFNPSTVIRYSLIKPSQVKLSIFNLVGQEIKKLKDAYQNTGEYSMVWDATDDENNPVSSGVYYYKLETNDMHHYKKMVLVR